MFGVVIVAGSGYVAYRHIRDLKLRRKRSRGDRNCSYGSIDIEAGPDVEDASTNTSPLNTVTSSSTQYATSDDHFDCVITSPVDSGTLSGTDADSISTVSSSGASLVSRGSQSPKHSQTTGWFARFW